MQSDISDSEISYIKNYILTYCPTGYQPSITFLLSPPDEAGNITDNNISNINNINLKKVINKIAYFGVNNIASIPCLYTDDKDPDWRSINNHINNWKIIHNYMKNYISGYLLSIETNEKANNINNIRNAFNIMKNNLSGVELYSTHLQYKSSGIDWNKESDLFSELNIIFVENSWSPTDAKDIDINKFSNEIEEIAKNNPNKKMIFIEYNVFIEDNSYAKQKNKLIELANKYPNIVGIG